MKSCRICGLVKPLDDFYKRSEMPDGHRSECSDCTKATRQARYDAEPERHRKEALASYRRHREERQAYKRRYYAERKEALAARQREWNAANPELLKKQRGRRKARMRGGVIVEDIDRQTVWDRDGGVCGICLEACDPQDFHIDHIIPVSKGGLHAYTNVQLAHPACNRHKAARIAA